MAAKTAGTWVVIGHDQIGVGGIGQIDSTKLYDLGRRCRARDVGATAYGFGEFIYLSGCASTVRGSIVLITDAYGTSLAAARDKGAMAIATAATVAATYGWYQIRGQGVAACGTVLANAAVYLAGSGTVDDDAVAGDCVIGMRTVTTDDTSTCVVSMAMNPACADFDNA